MCERPARDGPCATKALFDHFSLALTEPGAAWDKRDIQYSAKAAPSAPAPVIWRGLRRDASARTYFKLALTEPNVAVSFVPSVVTAPMMATAISDAISPYSIAVAPLSSWAKRLR